ncbi:hypothetical protein [Micromonospora robiginosa]|uniref:Uncharacterized protein n=1 Tax=Micromonospora robiginosa TaxID=2749844 RepID=A0A7L6BBX0_9ACTN|nr:hypothetical protein [Micromonospora ferruginea]QLQ39473.1 hypothetical protein H1D33_11945 [Micromonospora ferruginea]
MSATTLYVPCEVIRVRVTYGYGEGLSPIELVMLGAVCQRPDGVAVEELLTLFRLGERVTLDLLGDLLRRGYVVVDFGTAMVRPAPGIGPMQLGALRGAERSKATVDLMVDRLVGAVFPVEEGRRRSGDYRFEVPAPLNAHEDRITEAQLLAVLDRAFERDQLRRKEKRLPGRTPRVIAAHLAPDHLGSTGELRWLPVDVTVREDEATNLLRFAVTDRRLTVAQRALAESRLGQLVADQSDSRFAQALRGCVDRTFTEPPTLPELLSRFNRQTAAAGHAKAGTRIQRHQDLRADYESIANELRALRDAEIEATAVGGRERHDELVAQLVADAHQQIVLVCPTLHYDVLMRYFPLLEAALGRGVQVVLIWGDGREAELPSKVRTALSSLQWRNDGSDLSRLLSSTMPSRLNAALVVADDREALVTGYHFLRRDEIGLQQVGLHVRAPHAGPCLPIESLLLWARRTLQHQYGQLMLVRHDEFDPVPVGAPARVTDAAPRWPESEAPAPGPPPEGETDELTASQVKLWAEQWQNAAARLAQLVAGRTLPRVRLVEDAAHRELLWDALRRPGRRLVLGGFLAHPDALDPRLLTAIDERASAGRRISLVYHRSTASGTGRDAHGSLQGLGGATPVTAERRPTNARVLVTDDRAVVGSFDFVGSSGRTGARYREKAELGLEVVGRQVVDDIARLLGIEVVESEAPVASEQAPAVELSAAGRLLGAVANLPADDRAGVVVAHLTGNAEDWQLLEDLHHVDAPDEILRVAAAAMLRRDQRRNTPTAQRWMHWLAGEAWHRGAFVEAALLRSAVVDPVLRPRTKVTAVAAARRGPRVGSALIDAWSDDLASAEHQALAVLAAVDLLLADGQPAVLSNLVDNDVPDLLPLFELVEPWADLVTLTTRYWKSTSGPLPLRVINADNAGTDRRQVLDSAWQSLGTAVDQCRNARLGFKLASRHLFGTHGVYHAIVDAVADRNVDAVREWVGGAGGVDAQEQFSAAEREAAGLRKPTPVARTQPYVDRMRRIQDAAGALLRCHDEEVGEAQDLRADVARVFARQLHHLWPRLRQASVDGPESIVIETALDDLALVQRWGST